MNRILAYGLIAFLVWQAVQQYQARSPAGDAAPAAAAAARN